MKIDLFNFCDFAADYSGKLTVVGVTESLYTKQAPTVVRQCCVALRLRHEKKDDGKHTIKLSIADSDGKTVAQVLESELDLKAPEGIPSGVVQLALGISNLSLPKIGVYSIDLHVDSRLLGSTPLYVFQVNA